ncbi:hypothetical protein M153_5710004709 [Pseudoloma neurophilia]|uniref:Protein SDA1 n=1 Tax=Pseudoloma neurophilia TaxID=146866 RepID=A0A0R0M4K6_9MICR|nr:hypothetical protein M153_5710004709 [Pseudoloma neurophilia]
MDFEILQAKIKKDPVLYENEYQNVIETYESMTCLPVIPDTSNYIRFISLTCHYYKSDISEVVLRHFDKITETDLKRNFFYYLGIIHRKKKLSKGQYIDCLFKCTFKLDLLRTANDLLYEFENQNHISQSNLHQILKITKKIEPFLENDSIINRKTALFFLIYIYDSYNILELNTVIINCLKDSSLQSMVVDYILELVPLEKSSDFKAKLTKNKKRGKKGFDYKKFRDEQAQLKLEKKIKKEKKFHQKKDVQDILDQAAPIIKTLNPENSQSEHQNIENIISNSNLYENMASLSKISKIITEMKNPHLIADLLFRQVSERKDTRQMRLKKLKVISLVKSYFKLSIDISTTLLRMIDPSSDDLPFVIHILIRSVEKSQMSSVISRIVQLFLRKPDSDMKCFGLNLLREIVLIDRSEPILEKIKDLADDTKNQKGKGVFYMYSMLMRAIKYGTTDNTSVEYHMKRRKLI